MKNCIFVNKYVSGFLHPLSSQLYVFTNDHHNHNTRFASNVLLKITINNALICGKKLFATSKIAS